MDELQDRLAVLALSRLADYGFVLAGGYALQAHGYVDRPSEDIDLFTDSWNPQDFTRAVETVTAAYTQAGLDVTVVRRAKTFARLEVGDPATGQTGQ